MPATFLKEYPLHYRKEGNKILDQRYFRVRADISLDAIRGNILAGKKLLPEGTKTMAVVKADAYGHGAVVVARNIEDIVDEFAVAVLEEGLELRQAGIKKPILILGHTDGRIAAKAIENNIQMTVFSLKTAKEYNEISEKLGKKAKLHIKLDTGMNRIGYQVTPECFNENLSEILKYKDLKNVEIVGIFTHLCKADDEEKDFSEHQVEIFKDFVSKLEEKGMNIPVKHACASAGIIDIPEGDQDMVRFGITMYGMYPSDHVTKEKMPIRPAMELKSEVSFIKTLEAGSGIGYSGTYVTDKREIIATIPVGYGDGYPRALSNKGWVLIQGKKAPIRGRICMDQFMVDITDIPGVKEGDVVTLMGRDGDEVITAETIGELTETSFHYEVVCNVAKRVPRVYTRDGKIIDVKSCLPLA